MIQIKLSLFLAIFLSNMAILSASSNPYFIINMVKIDNPDKELMTIYEENLGIILSEYNGEFQIPTLHIKEQLKSLALPENTVDFNFTHFYILKFENKKAVKNIGSLTIFATDIN